MAMCPVCAGYVRTPLFLNLDGWRHLVCPQCKTRLEMKPPLAALFAPLMAPLFVLARQGPLYEVIAFAYMFATFLLLLVECIRPKVQLRKKPLPQPETLLDLGGSSKQN